jgi:hypothetical protein
MMKADGDVSRPRAGGRQPDLKETATKPIDASHRPPRPRRGRRVPTWVWIVAALVAAAWVFYLLGAGGRLADLFTSGRLWTRLGRPLLRTLIFISAGLLAGQLIEGLGWTARLGRLAWPLINWARLPGEAGAAFTSAFVSGILANTLLFTSCGKADVPKSVGSANLLNATLPAYVLHMPTTMLVIVSLTGRAGLIYVALTFLAMLLRFLGIVALSRLLMPRCPTCTYQSPGKAKPGNRSGPIRRCPNSANGSGA